MKKQDSKKFNQQLSIMTICLLSSIIFPYSQNVAYSQISYNFQLNNTFKTLKNPTLSNSKTILIAKSTDRDKPTFLTSNVITGRVERENHERFYTFVAGPGEVIVKLDATPEKGFIIVEVNLFDTNAQELLSLRANTPTDASERVIKRLKLDKKQRIEMRILEKNPDSSDRKTYQGRYKVELSGAIQLNGNQTTAPNRKNSVINVPSQGKLYIEMKDGTKQELDLNRVRQIYVIQ